MAIVALVGRSVEQVLPARVCHIVNPKRDARIKTVRSDRLGDGGICCIWHVFKKEALQVGRRERGGKYRRDDRRNVASQTGIKAADHAFTSLRIGVIQ